MYMASIVQHVEAGDKMSKAVDLMKKFSIRHLPVLDKGKIVGMLSDRDVKLASGIADDMDDLIVADVCHTDPYIVAPDTPLAQVASTMADKHYGSAMVVSNGKLAGIFTATDACRVLADMIKFKV
jgi:acetoin utilization protein AcuB